MGRRLRVDYSNDGGAGDSAPAGYTAPPPQPYQHSQQPSADGMQQQSQQQLPPLPPGADLPPNLTCPDAISQTLSTLPAPQLLDIISQMKGLVTSDPGKATELLRQAPQLSYAIFQSLLLLGLVDTTVLASVVPQAQQPAPPPQPTQQYLPVQQQQPHQQQPMHPQYPPHLQHMAPAAVHTPPPQMQHYQPAPQPIQPPAQAAPDQGALIAQIINMTQQQIDGMPPTERMQLMTLRQQLRMQGYPVAA